MEGEKVPGSGRDIPDTNGSRHDTFLDSERGPIIPPAEHIRAFAGRFALMPFKSILLAMRKPAAESIRLFLGLQFSIGMVSFRMSGL
jgi:hypothetical protein